MAKRILIIAYQFPPVGGAGVQRVSKFVKYLPDFGWSPTVLTVSNPSVPVFDSQLAAEVAEADIRTAKTYEPGYAAKQAVSASVHGERRGGLKTLVKKSVRAAANIALQPDPQILWYPQAVKAGREILQEGGYDAILATGPPFSSFLLAKKLGREFRIPYVLDFRDEWDISNTVWENKGQGRFSLALQRRMQSSVLRDAAAVIATTQSSSESLSVRCQQAGSHARNEVVFNGFDDRDMQFVRRRSAQSNERFRLSYVGTLWNLTSIQPLVDAVISLASRNPESLRHLELVFAGRRTDEQEAHLDRLESTPVTLERRPYIDHGEAVELMDSSDALCLTLSDLPHARRVIPAKMFEYMAAKKRVFGVLPQGDAWELLAEYPGAVLKVPGDVFGIRDSLLTELDYFVEFGRQEFDYVDLHRFSRRALTGELSNVLDEVAGLSEPTTGRPTAVEVEAVGAR